MSFDTRPQTVDIHHYGGDTLSIHIKIDAAVVAEREWSAQVRSRRGGSHVDATFIILPDEHGAYVQLKAEDTLRLSARNVYTGFWDVQLAPAGGGDPVTTLVEGTLRIYPDVTRSQA
jgi:hypothetical protein